MNFQVKLYYWVTGLMLMTACLYFWWGWWAFGLGGWIAGCLMLAAAFFSIGNPPSGK